MNVTDQERIEFERAISRAEISRVEIESLLSARYQRIMAEARDSIRARPFGRWILACVDAEMRVTLSWWAWRDRVRGRRARRRYSARH